MDGVEGMPGEPRDELMTENGDPRLPMGELTEEVIAEPIMEGCRGVGEGGEWQNG